MLQLRQAHIGELLWESGSVPVTRFETMLAGHSPRCRRQAVARMSPDEGTAKRTAPANKTGRDPNDA